jgi:membrane-associated phospholipid phosphatase
MDLSKKHRCDQRGRKMCEWLQSLVPWGTEVLVKIQSHSNELLMAIFTIFTFLGYEEFYLFAFPLILWCIDKRIGTRLAYVSLFSSWINSVFKYLYSIPRPADPRLNIPRPETSPSFPSGHAQNAVVNWGYVALQFRNRTLWMVTIVVILCIGLSRMVLGVHFPQDVVGGWIIGIVLLLIFAWAEPRASPWIVKQKMPVRFALAIVVPVILIFLHPADTEGLYPAPESISPMGALVGIGVGVIMERAWVRFRVDGEWWRRGLRLLLGLVVVGVLYIGPKLTIPEGSVYGLEALLRFVRYALAGWAALFLCPWLFVKLRLAEQSLT